MTDTDQQITPADATIVSTGTGTKGPEERELPESLSNDMSLCLRILRDVLANMTRSCWRRSTPCATTR